MCVWGGGGGACVRARARACVCVAGGGGGGKYVNLVFYAQSTITVVGSGSNEDKCLFLYRPVTHYKGL